ncbi:adenosine deaminase [Myxozyma melibiosi]|uniref:Adenosine deaminase n=1 Tax=Myxozyma melibiosi TaxID=54550 RepID=A0ABR1F4Z5_9ASCO
MDCFIHALPKCEHHVHLEGTLSPAHRLLCAQRNNIALPNNISSLSVLEKELYPADYDYEEGQDGSDYLREFLANYYGAMEVLITPEDFRGMAAEYIERARKMNVRYAEVFFDPQAHTSRGVPLETVMQGLLQAREDEKKLHEGKPDYVRIEYILCFLRDMSADSAIETWKAAVNGGYLKDIIGVGLDSDEDGHPPQKFDEVFEAARKAGLKITAHCDVDQPGCHANIAYVATKLGGPRNHDGPTELFLTPKYDAGADRIDHGLNCADNPELLELIKKSNLGLTLCPMGYSKHLGPESVFRKLELIKQTGIPFCLNSDDPAYMCRYKEKVVIDVQGKTGWTMEEIAACEINAIHMSWTKDLEFKKDFVAEVERVLKEFSK